MGIPTAYFFFSAFILSLITLVDIWIKFKGPLRFKFLMLLLIFSNAGLAFISFIPVKTIGLQLVAILFRIIAGTAILRILSAYLYTKTKKWINLFPVFGILLLVINAYSNRAIILNTLSNENENLLFISTYYKDISNNSLILVLRILLFLSFLFFYFSFVYQLINKYKGYNNLYAKKLCNWLIKLLIAPVIVLLLNFIFLIDSNAMIGVVLSIGIYFFNALIFLYRPEFINKGFFKHKLLETNTNLVADTKMNEQVFVNEFYNKAYFTNSSASLQGFSEIINTSQNDVSNFVTLKFNCGFGELIHKNRIDLFKELATKPEFNNYTIEALAKEVGFSSRQTFYTAFKKFDGGSPADFLR